MNGLLVRDAGDVEQQKLFVEHFGDFIVAKHLPLEHRRSDTAADSDGDHTGEQVEGRTTHEVKELPFVTPDGGLYGLGFWLLGHGNVDRGCSSRDRILQKRRVRIIGHGVHQSCLHLVWAEDHAPSDKAIESLIREAPTRPSDRSEERRPEWGHSDTKAAQRSLDKLRWGLIPYWAKDIKVGFANINAKGEGIESKPAFRKASESRRCLVPVDSFYE